MLEERILDLPMREADVAIRLKEPSQAELIRRRLMEVHIRLYASRGLRRSATACRRRCEELADHRLITQSPTSPQVRAGAEFVQPFLAAAPASSLTVNNYFGILQGGDPRPRHRLAARLPDAAPRSGEHPARRSRARRSRSTSPMSRNCVIPSGSARFAISCWRRSPPSDARAARAPTSRGREPCVGRYGGHAQQLGIAPCRTRALPLYYNSKLGLHLVRSSSTSLLDLGRANARPLFLPRSRLRGVGLPLAGSPNRKRRATPKPGERRCPRPSSIREPEITDALVAAHGLKPDEYQRILDLIGRDADADRARHLLGDVERALLLQVARRSGCARCRPPARR